MIIIFSLIVLLYCAFTLALVIAWRNTPYYTPDSKMDHDTFISVIIPVRNEAANIFHLLDDLNRQDYPMDKLEVIVVDDHSEDETRAICRNFILQARYSLKILALSEDFPEVTSKKQGLTKGIHLASGKLIVTTDGDCRVRPSWISTVQSFYKKKNCRMVTGPVAFHQEHSLFERMQSIEFAILTGSGATLLRLGLPSMCNGANLAFEKEAFMAVNGYRGFEDIASGDDEFLMHKIHAHYHGGVLFLKSRSAQVYTRAQKSMSGFLNQRRRWAGKWKRYTALLLKILAAFIFFFNLFLLIAAVLVLAGYYPLWIFLLQFLLKSGFELLFLENVLSVQGKKTGFSAFVLTALIYPFYAVFFGLFSGTKRKYYWKGRKVS